MAKRANGEGTKIVKVPNRNLYNARFTDANGKRRSVYGKSKLVVRHKLIESLADRDKGLTYDGDTVTLREHLDRWLETSVRGSVKPITYEAYERMCRVHIVPALGKVKLSKLLSGETKLRTCTRKCQVHARHFAPLLETSTSMETSPRERSSRH